MKNILITGHKGYIGSNLVAYLPQNKYKIYGMDKKDGGYVEFLSEIKEVDCIVHLAAVPGIKACEDDLEKSIINNISSTYRVFKISVDFKVPVVFLSSQAAKDPKSSNYAMMKKIAEVQAENLNKNTTANIRVLRATNVYGGIDYLKKKNTVVKKFIHQRKNGTLITIDGDGKQTRDFIHVEDVCEFIIRSINMPNNVKIVKPVDIGTGKQTSILELAKMFGDWPISFNKESRSVGVKTNFADTRQSFEVFNYKAKDRLKEYIEERIKRNV